MCNVSSLLPVRDIYVRFFSFFLSSSSNIKRFSKLSHNQSTRWQVDVFSHFSCHNMPVCVVLVPQKALGVYTALSGRRGETFFVYLTQVRHPLDNHGYYNIMIIDHTNRKNILIVESQWWQYYITTSPSAGAYILCYKHPAYKAFINHQLGWTMSLNKLYKNTFEHWKEGK